jgi:hypothetical protein
MQISLLLRGGYLAAFAPPLLASGSGHCATSFDWCFSYFHRQCQRYRSNGVLHLNFLSIFNISKSIYSTILTFVDTIRGRASEDHHTTLMLTKQRALLAKSTSLGSTCGVARVHFRRPLLLYFDQPIPKMCEYEVPAIFQVLFGNLEADSRLAKDCHS